jgi:Galactose-3-O-sulfotransferase
MPFSPGMVSRPGRGDIASTNFQIFAAHSLWNARAIEQLIPGAHTFTILREPVSAFESYFVYGGYDRKYGDINQFAELLDQG